MLIELLENSSVCKITKDGISKVVNVDDVCRCFSTNASYSYEDIPEGCRRVVKNGNRIAFVFTLPAAMRRYTTQYCSGDRDRYNINEDAIIDSNFDEHNYRNCWITVKIPYPALVIVSTFIKEANSSEYRFYNQYAFASDNINKDVSDIELYKWPFTNVYSDRHVCTGDIDYNYTVDQISSTPGILLDGIGNHDLENMFPTNDLGVSTSYDAVAYFANHPEVISFPKQLLGTRLYSISEAQNNWVV